MDKSTIIGTTSEQLPDDWKMVPLGDVFKPITVRLNEINGSSQPIPILSMTRAHGLVLQSEKFDKRVASRDTSNYKVVKSGQLVYGFPIDEGVIAILHRYPIGAVSPAYQVWEPISDVDLTFIDYMLKTPFMINAYKMFSSNVVERRRNLAQKDFVRIPIALPPLPEQRAIAHVLSTVRQAIEATENVINAARELKRSMMKHLFTYGPVPVDQADQVPLKETMIGEVPMDWNIMPLGELIREDIKNGAFIKRTQFGSGTPLLNVADTYKDLSVDISQLERVMCLPNDLEMYALHLNDLVFVRSSLKREGVGHCCIVEIINEPSIFDCHLMRVRVQEDKAIPKFLAYFFISPIGKNALISRSKTTTMTTINQSGLASTFAPLPTLSEQEVVSTYLTKIDNKIYAESQQKTALEAIFNSLLHHLMAGKVRVRVSS